MKKLLVLFFALILAGGFVFAQNGGLGLSVGAEFGIENMNKANDIDETYPYLMPMIIFENSFLDNSIDLYAELDYTYGFTKETGTDGNDANPQVLYFDLVLGFNLDLGYGSTLSFLVENENESIIAPKYDHLNSFGGLLTPGLKFTQETAFGDFYAQADYPFYYRHPYKDADFASGLNFTVGLDNSYGFGIKVQEYNSMTPKMVWYNGLDLTLSYDTGIIYAEVKAEIGKYFDYADAIKDEVEPDRLGVSIIPELVFSLLGFTAYINCRFDYIGAKVFDKKADVMISPAIGIKYSF